MEAGRFDAAFQPVLPPTPAAARPNALAARNTRLLRRLSYPATTWTLSLLESRPGRTFPATTQQPTEHLMMDHSSLFLYAAVCILHTWVVLYSRLYSLYAYTSLLYSLVALLYSLAALLYSLAVLLYSLYGIHRHCCMSWTIFAVFLLYSLYNPPLLLRSSFCVALTRRVTPASHGIQLFYGLDSVL